MIMDLIGCGYDVVVAAKGVVPSKLNAILVAVPPPPAWGVNIGLIIILDGDI